MANGVLRATIPYLIGLTVAVALFIYSQSIEYTPRRGHLGPGFWPQLATGVLAAACLVEIAKGLLGRKSARDVAASTIDNENPEHASAHPWLLISGTALMGSYAALVTSLGFLLASFLFLAGFMYLGRYRNHLAIWTVSLGVTLLVAVLFLNFAYISLPRGVPPFDRVTDFVRIIVGG
jgi:putative tricarboxylic transport membrane protein